VVGSLDSDPEDPKFKSEPETAKKNQKNGRNSPQQILRGECKKKHKRWDNPRQEDKTKSNTHTHTHTHTLALVAQRQSVYNIVSHPT